MEWNLWMVTASQNTGMKENNDLYLSVEDNGLGMTEEQVERLFTDTSHDPFQAGFRHWRKERK